MLLVGLSNGTFYAVLGFGILGLLLGFFSTIFFLNFKKSKKAEKDTFRVITIKFKIFRF